MRLRRLCLEMKRGVGGRDIGSDKKFEIADVHRAVWRLHSFDEQ